MSTTARDFDFYANANPDRIAEFGNDGRPCIPDNDPLLMALIRAHGIEGRPDIAAEFCCVRNED